MGEFTLKTLETIIAKRAKSADARSYTRELINKGTLHCAKKLGEEAVELGLAAVAQKSKDVRNEAADLLYHFMVVLHAREVKLSDVLKELERRTAKTGLEEKASRK